MDYFMDEFINKIIWIILINRQVRRSENETHLLTT